MDDRGVVQVVVEVPGHRADHVEVLVEEPADRVLAVAELPYGDRRQHDEHPADRAFHGQEPQDEQIAQHLAARDERGVGGRPGAVRVAEHEVAAAQTAPRRTERGGRVQPRAQRVFLGEVGDVPAARAGTPVPVDPHRRCPVSLPWSDAPPRRDASRAAARPRVLRTVAYMMLPGVVRRRGRRTDTGRLRGDGAAGTPGTGTTGGPGAYAKEPRFRAVYRSARSRGSGGSVGGSGIGGTTRFPRRGPNLQVHAAFRGKLTARTPQ